MTPEISTKYFFVVKSIRNNILHLLFDWSIKIFQRVNNYSFFLTFKSFLQSYLELSDFLIYPLRFVAYFFNMFGKLAFDLGSYIFNIIDSSIFKEALIDIISKLSQALICNMFNLVGVAQLNFSL